MILKLFIQKFFKKEDDNEYYAPLKKTYVVFRLIKKQRNTTNIFYLRTFLRYFAV